ncbi:hypothetical protein HGI30_22075 [Paenibacillus albicereus]|uniref:Uncharacterized protein n=1 Tax=Paenibacillus albicereus TaxID=2726185 RepID=A0A6H2H2R2_9BACL|nr:hypothetical protein [Paenibacillus albicereus]QJC53947.1 hypothetical protein HGI30_22075 [Paenibacillus albicereus]
MKKIKQPGENISLKTKKNESPEVMDWINGQSNLMDSIRYLVENEIRANGVRNLQLFIPAERGILVAGTAGGAAALVAAAGATAQPEAVREAAVAADEVAAAGEASAAAGEAAAAAEVEIEQNRYADAEDDGGEGDVAGAASTGVDLEGDDIDDDDIDSWM